ncbi:MAG: CRISPR-associated helicase Cas3' [Anaeromusa sp.]|uniref:CRISPR-associated helicase Cas3' n=1 Tax=Anaeromusa sp. TaxID=1872520 RepID=UPI002B1E96CA|nr:CRISPR-associated helicase Cas3' [Anaeromusa sp.]MEA4834171.1 CRISPR-associated helicase Cas3' [Anaeromusa sp.]
MYADSDCFIAHIRRSDKVEQYVYVHNDNVAALAFALGKQYGLENIARVAGRHHDDGKNTPEFDAYIRDANAGKSVVRGSVIHSTHGAVLLEQLTIRSDLYSRLTSEMVCSAIMSHHGLKNCLSPDGSVSFMEAAKRISDSYGDVKDYVYCHYGSNFIKNEFLSACNDVKVIPNKIKCLQSENEHIGSPQFYLSMYTRLLTSIVIDADRTDTSCFEDETALPQIESCADRKLMWRNYLAHCERMIKKLQQEKVPSSLDQYRAEISQSCAEFDGGESGIFRLVVPCGAGKTLSALRYSLQTAKHYGKKNIFYISPFNSILEQNASEIIKFVGDPDAVLEHHSNIVFDSDDSEDEKRYNILIENWTQSPIIATTAVQFLNTLFSGKTSSIRRMQALGNSVIILDEIQALPIKVLKLFNAAMNFLSYFCSASVVLCSATQPLLDKLDTYRILPPRNMIGDEAKYSKAFKRVEIVDCLNGNGFSMEEAANFILTQANNVKSILAIVNTKVCAREIFKYIRGMTDNVPSYRIFHLSTNMCPAHRIEVLTQMRELLEIDNLSEKIICISTSLIEAGVDISFERVIRSLTGLDSIVQAAGRCNRNHETTCGMVSIINIRDEHVGTMGYAKKAQEATRELLYNVKTYPERYPGGVLSKPAMEEYYARYFKPLLREMEYPLKADPEITVLDLLTVNPAGSKRLREKNSNTQSMLLKQAFKEAGEAFSVIDDEGKVAVIAQYDSTVQLHLEKLKMAISFREKRSLMRHLQRYTVQLREDKLQHLQSTIQFNEAGVIVLPLACYDCEYGVDETRDIPMEVLVV